ncbi:hypothetical protein HDU82_000291 [Entophlyctis luteolus]|nr:hypothetical protein HDU82_000291 [Entophlyctis luteolus]
MHCLLRNCLEIWDSAAVFFPSHLGFVTEGVFVPEIRQQENLDEANAGRKKSRLDAGIENECVSADVTKHEKAERIDSAFLAESQVASKLSNSIGNSDLELKWSGLDVMKDECVLASWDSEADPCLVIDYCPSTSLFILQAPLGHPQPPPIPRSAFFTRHDGGFLSCNLGKRTAFEAVDDSETSDSEEETAATANAHSRNPNLSKTISVHVLPALASIISGRSSSLLMDAWRRGDIRSLQALVLGFSAAESQLSRGERLAVESAIKRAVDCAGATAPIASSVDFVSVSSESLVLPPTLVGNGLEEALRRDRLVVWVLMPEGIRLLASALLQQREEFSCDGSATGPLDLVGSNRAIRGRNSNWAKRVLTLRQSLLLGQKASGQR